VESQGTEYIFHIGQVSALYKINNTDSSGRDYRICSQFPPYSRSALDKFYYIYHVSRRELIACRNLRYDGECPVCLSVCSKLMPVLCFEILHPVVQVGASPIGFSVAPGAQTSPSSWSLRRSRGGVTVTNTSSSQGARSGLLRGRVRTPTISLYYR
jgi:hypothetical protein